ncbi:MAG: primosomal protein N' [Anaerolineaceae bacterium]|nr:primosomal protein N' [Anaerolineaceae bacterium]
MNYIRVAVNQPGVQGVFDYHLPENLEGRISPGMLVVVPFGSRRVQAIVLERVDTPAVMKTKPVEALLDPQPVVTTAQIDLAHVLARETLAPLSACLELMLPPGVKQQADILYHLMEKEDGDKRPLTDLQEKIVALLAKRGDLRGRQVAAAFPHQNWKSSMQALVRRGQVQTKPVLSPPTVRPKMVRTVQLACSPEQALARMDDLGSGKAGERRQAILRFLIDERVPVNVSWAYASSGGNLQDLSRLAEKGLVTLGEGEEIRDPMEKMSWQPTEPPTLTAEQAKVWQQVETRLMTALAGDAVPPVLLHGVTGSGKTEIYLRAAAEAVAQGRQVVILVPEISLTPQTVRRFLARFPGQVGVIHSRLSAGERYDTWRRARAGELPVIVGPRSALFTPLPRVGLVVVDEFHDESYYQNDSLPYYHAVQTTLIYTKLTNALAILGSATPDVSLLQRAKTEDWDVLRLPVRILAHVKSVESQLRSLGLEPPKMAGSGETTVLPLPPVDVVDMRQELKAGNLSIFSRNLQESLAEVLAKKQQAILFLNRRGSDTYVFCRDCGYALKCPRCDMPLVHHRMLPANHRGKGSLRCNTCGYQRQMPKKCPKCGSTRIKGFGTGTEKVEAEVLKLFPAARVVRWDAETARLKGAHDMILSHFLNRRADILVGTQMIAKGLDLPLVTLVGVVLADVGLNFPDYRASERSFQLLTQVAGRAGRSPLGGKAVLQTFQPQHYVIRAAAQHDFDGFLQQELAYRRQLQYPPYYRLARLEFRHRQSGEAEAAARRMAGQLQGWIAKEERRATSLIGPVPCFFSRVKGEYRWQIVVRGPDPAGMLRGKDLRDWRVEIDPVSLL